MVPIRQCAVKFQLAVHLKKMKMRANLYWPVACMPYRNGNCFLSLVDYNFPILGNHFANLHPSSLLLNWIMYRYKFCAVWKCRFNLDFMYHISHAVHHILFRQKLCAE